MKEETRKVVVLDWKDKINLQQIIKDLEQVLILTTVFARM